MYTPLDTASERGLTAIWKRQFEMINAEVPLGNGFRIPWWMIAVWMFVGTGAVVIMVLAFIFPGKRRCGCGGSATGGGAVGGGNDCDTDGGESGGGSGCRGWGRQWLLNRHTIMSPVLELFKY